MKNKPYSLLLIILMSFILLSCRTIPENASPITPFEAKRYLGKWYEIARFDFRFERNLNNVTARYSLNEDGTIRVHNSGYHVIEKKWETAEGKAKFRGDEGTAALKVSFFGPFYSAYNVIALDEDYRYALVAGKNLDYLWILSRTPAIPDNIREKYLDLAKGIGYDTSKLIWVEHNMENPDNQ